VSRAPRAPSARTVGLTRDDVVLFSKALDESRPRLDWILLANTGLSVLLSASLHGFGWAARWTLYDWLGASTLGLSLWIVGRYRVARRRWLLARRTVDRWLEETGAEGPPREARGASPPVDRRWN
jgi:hypothetical protein